MEIDDDEDFDLETPSRTQSLGMNYYYFLLYRKSSHRAEKVEQEKTVLREIRPMRGIEKFYKYFEIGGWRL